MAKNPNEMERTKLLMAALVRQPPKPHEEMKIGKPKGKTAKSPRKRGASAKPKTA
jgi:hypothetical protein